MKKNYLIILLLVSFNVFTQTTHPRSVDEYAQLLKKIKDGKNNEESFTKKVQNFYSRLTNEAPTIESAYSKGMQAINDLEGPLGNNENEINTKWLQEMRTKLEGFELNPNTETFVASPNLEFFKSLSKKYGSPADIAFFELILKMQPSNSYFPVYIQQQTDLSGCTIYDGSLTKFHRDWTYFQQNYPQSYREKVKSYIGDIEKNLSDSRCFCDKTKEPILKELESFLKKNPKLTVTAKIKKRISDINSKNILIPGCN